MKSIKMALLGGAAIAVSAAGAQADELQDLKAQVEALNARMAAMETAPSVPAGYQLLAISKGEALQVPGLEQDNRSAFAEGNRATIISVMPTADAPAGVQISWSGYVNVGVVYNNNEVTGEFQRSRSINGGAWEKETWSGAHIKQSNDSHDWDVKNLDQLKVNATTDTAVGEVGVMLQMRASIDGNGSSDVYMDSAWGWWAMTPELTFGGGYADSLGKISYGEVGSCNCYWNDSSDNGFNPGKATQVRLTYGSGPFSMAVALEDASISDEQYNGNNLGVAGELKYSGDMFSGEISGVYRSTNSDSYDNTIGVENNIDGLWQIGAGLAFNLGDVANLSLAAAMGEGPAQTVNNITGTIDDSFNVNQTWWGVSGLASANLSDTIHAEVGAGYKNRQGDNANALDTVAGNSANPEQWNYQGFDYDTWSILGGVYYNPVDQLTIGLEGEWYTKEFSISRTGDLANQGLVRHKETLDVTTDNWTVDLVSIWRF